MDELERNLVQASIDGIIVNDMLGNVLIFNEGAARILGYRVLYERLSYRADGAIVGLSFRTAK